MNLETIINADALSNLMISFFVEYPNQELDKIELLDFPTKLYIAAKNIGEFHKIKSNIKNKHVKEVIYWPVLNDDEGYWLSPFTKRETLLRIIDETKNNTVLWDAELPKRKYQILTRLFGFFRNKREIEAYFKSHGKAIYTAEYSPDTKLLKILGLSFEPTKFSNKQIKMIYSSMHNYSEKVVRKKIRIGTEKYKDNFMVGFGTLATGVKGDEPQIKPEILERDLMIAREYGLKEVVIYRLGGLNNEYLRIIKKYNKLG